VLATSFPISVIIIIVIIIIIATVGDVCTRVGRVWLYSSIKLIILDWLCYENTMLGVDVRQKLIMFGGMLSIVLVTVFVFPVLRMSLPHVRIYIYIYIYIYMCVCIIGFRRDGSVECHSVCWRPPPPFVHSFDQYTCRYWHLRSSKINFRRCQVARPHINNSFLNTGL
jgi:hypothetical protein